ncbi:MAG: lipoxygenase family protein [Myxococcota bacterium]
MTIPSLPQDDTETAARAERLTKAREDYQFDFSYQEIVSAKDLPFHEKADPAYWAAIAKVMAELKANQVASRTLEENVDALGESVVQGLAEVFAKLTPKEVGEKIREQTKVHPDAADLAHADYDRMYARIDPPAIAPVWQRDDIFAWQALAGTNPIMITRLKEALPHFPVTQAHFEQAIPGDRLEAAIAEGRVYIEDYAILDGIPTGNYEGEAKYIFAPLAMYAQSKEGAFVPIAIQCGQRPDAHPIFTPADGASWKMARTVVTSAEGNFQGIISHFAWCHEVMESVILSTHRELAANHPIHILLSPHFANTLITNDIAMTSLIGPNGNMERLQSGTLEASLDLAKRSLKEFRLLDSAPTKDFARRGVDDVDALPEYPFRDDGLLSWPILERWVHDYLRLYYLDDASVAADTEVARWVAELGSQDGGRLEGMVAPQTFDALVDLVAQIMFRCTVFHAAFNYTSYDFFAYAQNVQAASFGPGPKGEGDSDAGLRQMWPPYQAAYEGMHLFYTIFKVQLNRVGHYPADHFTDQRVAPLQTRLVASLDEVESTIAARDATRLFPYPYLLPSRVSNSIHV